MSRALTIFDLDGTLIEGHVDRPDPNGPFVQVLDFHDVRVLPGRRETLAFLLEHGEQIAIATNKAGVAFGHQTILDCSRKRAAVLHDLGLPITTRWYEAYGHPRADIPQYRFDDFDRKPNPGMLLKACLHAGVAPHQALMVGDMEADEGAACAAGTRFVWAAEYWEEGPFA